ncbi:hypothetical protein AURDEDRAFT_111690 [Auricularia subglabra TFB-10046 SS5]|nr:hypothetical protein AURDEDRAFT_111690 [Auricularia subglabra TFB-10046 SS5]
MPFVHGAVTLAVTTCSLEHTTIVSRFPHGPKKTLTLEKESDDWESRGWERFPPIFEQPASCFSGVHTLTMPITVLTEFAPDRRQFPALEELRLSMCRGMPLLDVARGGAAPRTGFPWHLVRWLIRIKNVRVVLDIEGASPEDIRAMMDVLAMSAQHLRLSVCGLSPQDVDIPDGLRLAFI